MYVWGVGFYGARQLRKYVYTTIIIYEPRVCPHGVSIVYRIYVMWIQNLVKFDGLLYM